MKTLSSLIITLSFLLWISFTTAKPSLASAAVPVRAIGGDPLVPGHSYNIVSATWGAGEGVVGLARTGYPSCEYSVVFRGRFDPRKADPVKFRIVAATNTDRIYVGSTNLEIEFVDKPNCAESSKWVATYEPESNSFKLVIGGPENHPDSNLVTGVFKIKTIGINYKLVFCPESNTVPSANSCYDVGLESFADGYAHLVANNFPFSFLFDEVKYYNNGKSIIRMKPE